jgi:glutamate/tyrosine decarboxylase-like PLP-dependent enzyme
MDAKSPIFNILRAAPPWLKRLVEKRLKAVPAVRRKIQQENEGALAGLESDLKPYRETHPAFARLPEQGIAPEAILEEMREMNRGEEQRWQGGFASGAVYHGEREHTDFLSQVYALHSQSNPLHADLWPSTVKYEAEIVAMTAEMLGGGPAVDSPARTPGDQPLPAPPASSPRGDPGDSSGICGTVTSGGTESILLAMKAYRDWARACKGIRRPEIIVPVTAHAAFEKAAQYFGIGLVRIPVGADCRADLRAARRAIRRNTIALVGSAPAFPHGAIDPIRELSELALERGLGFHTDACLGGFFLPWARELGYPVPDFDFRLPGVTSISVDTHKYGYAAKGTSVILYRGRELRRFQYYATGDWTGGLYVTPTLAGSRPGALSAACWAAMLSLGRQGYLEAARKILETADWIKRELGAIPDLRILGDPLWVIAFTSDSLDIYRVMEELARRGWSLNGLFSPPAVHLCVTLRHTQPGVKERFIEDLKEAVAAVREQQAAGESAAPIYGVAAGIPLRGLVVDMLKQYMDMLYSL